MQEDHFIASQISTAEMNHSRPGFSSTSLSLRPTLSLYLENCCILTQARNAQVSSKTRSVKNFNDHPNYKLFKNPKILVFEASLFFNMIWILFSCVQRTCEISLCQFKKFQTASLWVVHLLWLPCSLQLLLTGRYFLQLYPPWSAHILPAIFQFLKISKCLSRTIVEFS